jgi:hypothetical protein
MEHVAFAAVGETDITTSGYKVLPHSKGSGI